MIEAGPQPGALAVLARIRQHSVQARPGERCEMCTADVPDSHRHLVDLRDRSLMCVCQACGLLFQSGGAAGGRYLHVPDRYRVITDFAMSRQQWDMLQIPVAVAFFFRNSAVGDTSAFFPGPAGATECLLPLDTWSEVEASNPVLGSLAADVEALLVRTQSAPDDFRIECFIVPIDACYELVGHLRSLWRGFDGGREAHEQMSSFFACIHSRARLIGRHDADG